MKKVVSVLMVAVLVIAMTACGKSKAEKEFDKAYDAAQNFIDSMD